MRTIQDIYDQYDIMPNLREHMFRVAAVADIIIDHIAQPVNREEIITALLLHDMGNIIKFDLSYFPEFLEPQGLEYWQNVQQQFKDKYGDNEHEGHVAIAKELGVSDRIANLVRGVGFSYMCDSAQGLDWERKICSYVDQRVSPHGTAPLMDRLKEGGIRYGVTPDNERWDLVACAQELEQQIFEQCDIDPEDINDEAIRGYQEKYLDYQL